MKHFREEFIVLCPLLDYRDPATRHRWEAREINLSALLDSCEVQGGNVLNGSKTIDRQDRPAPRFPRSV